MLRFLTEAGKILNSSLDYNTTLASVANLAVSRIVDFCSIDLLDKQGKMQRVAVQDSEPEKKQLAKRLFKYPPDPNVRLGVYEVAKTGNPVLVSPVTDEWLKKVTIDRKDYLNVKRLGFTSQIFVPLRAREKTIGVLTLASRSNKHLLGKKDLILAQELAERAAIAVDNARLYKEARDAIRLRDEFLSIASHEFKNPVAAVLLQIQSVKSSLRLGKKDSSEKMLETLESAEAQVKKLSKLISDLLNVSLITTGRLTLDLEDVELSELTAEILKRHKKQFEKEGYSVTFTKERSLLKGYWDKIRIDQVLSNLISNAIKYGEKKPITITLKKKGSKGLFIISDQGIGIGKNAQKYIFDRFARGVSDKDFKGLGVGLYISRQIVRAHGGAIKLQSTIGVGSEFIVELPLQK